jgi:hypothetical protein
MNDMFSNLKAISCETVIGLTNGTSSANRFVMGKKISMMGLVGLSLAGCVQIAAPDKPIVINLNLAIGISGEVKVKLDQASKKLIDEKPEIF